MPIVPVAAPNRFGASVLFGGGGGFTCAAPLLHQLSNVRPAAARIRRAQAADTVELGLFEAQAVDAVPCKGLARFVPRPVGVKGPQHVCRSDGLAAGVKDELVVSHAVPVARGLAGMGVYCASNWKLPCAFLPRAQGLLCVHIVLPLATVGTSCLHSGASEPSPQTGILPSAPMGAGLQRLLPCPCPRMAQVAMQ